MIPEREISHEASENSLPTLWLTGFAVAGFGLGLSAAKYDRDAQTQQKEIEGLHKLHEKLEDTRTMLAVQGGPVPGQFNEQILAAETAIDVVESEPPETSSHSGHEQVAITGSVVLGAVAMGAVLGKGIERLYKWTQKAT